ncbi:MAG: hypothetical protein J6D33_04330 [Turicibacter sp.]|nr:hypothetical protein [Turicibacter sp.]
MTRRQRLEAVIAGNITEELIEDCKVELAKLDERSARANEEAKTSANYVENKRYEELICEVLSEKPIQIDELGELIGSTLTRQRLTAICTNLIREGRIKSCDVKVKNKGKRKAYYM